MAAEKAAGFPPPSVFAASFAAAGTAECITLPADTAKVRLQLDPMRKVYKGTFQTFQVIHASGTTFFPGLSVAVLRSGIYNSIRLSIYERTLSKMSSITGWSQQSLGTKVLTAIPVNAISIMCANPWDVIKVRCQKNPAYSEGVPSAHPSLMLKVIRTEGLLKGLYSGFSANLLRNCSIGSTELVTYFQAKQTLLNFGFQEGTPVHVMSSLTSGLMAVLIGSPWDVLGTRLMQADAVAEGLGAPKYAMRMFRDEGPQAFYKGFLLNWMRVGGFNLVMFVTYERARSLLEG